MVSSLVGTTMPFAITRELEDAVVQLCAHMALL